VADYDHLYWPQELVDDIDRFIEDARKGERTIYASTIILAEIRQEALRKRHHRSIDDFMGDMRNAVRLIDPNPNIMMAAGRLKDCRSTNPAKDGKATPRVIGTADAIHLATCLYLRDTMGVSGIVFHTFDDGKGKTWEGKCVPLLSFEKWFPEKDRPSCIKDVCSLERLKP
jgi:hypothetical protein